MDVNPTAYSPVDIPNLDKGKLNASPTVQDALLHLPLAVIL